MFDRIATYFKEARQELRHVNWPTRAEAVRLTTIVIAISLGISIYLGVFDYIFQYTLQHFILRS